MAGLSLLASSLMGAIDEERLAAALVGRGELTDKAWKQIVALLPENGRRGQQWKDHRKVINGILWKLRTGAPWRDLPFRYGPWQNLLRPFCALEVRRHLGSLAGPRAEQIRCGGRGGVGGERGQHHRPRSSARCRRA
jgi:transposase